MNPTKTTNQMTIPKGDGDDSTDTIPSPPNPVIEIINSIIKAYELTPEQLIQLTQQLWSRDFIESIMNILSNPIDAIIELGIIFVNKNIETSGEENIFIGNYKSNISANPIIISNINLTSEIFYVPMYYGNYHDFNGEINIFLPFCGVIPLPQYVFGKSIRINYKIDILSMNALILIECYVDGVPVVIERKTVNMGYRIPLSARDAQSYVSGVWSNPLNLIADNSIKRNGTISGNAQYLDVPYPYITITRTDITPNNTTLYNGMECNITSLGNVNGYITCDEVLVEIPIATEQEKEMIKNYLRNGVIL